MRKKTMYDALTLTMVILMIMCGVRDLSAKEFANEPAEEMLEVRPEIVTKALASYTLGLKRLVKAADKNLERVNKDLVLQAKEKEPAAQTAAQSGDDKAEIE